MGKKDVRRVDVYGTTVEFRDRIAEFLSTQVEYITLSARYSAKIKSYTQVLEDKSRPDRVWINEDEKAVAIARAEQELEDIKAEYKKLLDEKAKFTFSKEDNAFKKAYKNAQSGSQVRDAIREWCEPFNLKVANTDLEARIMGAISGKDKNTSRAKVNTGKCNADKRKESVALQLLYGEVADYMVEKGICLPMQFDDDIKAKYAPKSKKA